MKRGFQSCRDHPHRRGVAIFVRKKKVITKKKTFD